MKRANILPNVQDQRQVLATIENYKYPHKAFKASHLFVTDVSLNGTLNSNMFNECDLTTRQF